MRLFITFNTPDLARSLQIAQSVAPHTDTLVIGTLLLQHAGIEAVTAFRRNFPTHTIVADAKICDRAQEAVASLADAGAQIVSILAGTSNDMIFRACKIAEEKKVRITLDLLDAYSFGQSAMDAESLGVDSLLFRRLHDATQSESILEQWDETRGNTKLPIYIVGNINRKNIARIQNLHPNAAIIGTAIVEAADPAAEAAYFADLMREDAR